MYDYHQIAQMIDHAVLHPTQTTSDLKKHCSLVMKYEAGSICVKPYAVAETRSLLNGSSVKTGCVVGFPAGNSAIEVKVFEAELACRSGAQEVDFVINIARALEGDWGYLENEISAITLICHENDAVVKVIFETDYVNDPKHIRKLCELASHAGVDFVKTSTGFGYVKDKEGKLNYEGATLENVRIMRQSVAAGVGVKASGGIRSLKDLVRFYEAGCTRIGTSSTQVILEELKASS